MKDKENYGDLNIVLDENGNADMEYYYKEADKLRAEYISSISRAGINSIKNMVAAFIEAIACPKCFFSH